MADQPDLFAAIEADHRQSTMPLAARMRPRKLDEFVGQQHFLGDGGLLRRLLAADRLGSLIFFGPPGTGKTTLARILAHETKTDFVALNAISSGVKELREVLSGADDTLAATGQRTLVFIDEIHRFNKSQQDALLQHVENGVVTLIGATTANPFFALTSALSSRSTLLQFEPLEVADIELLLNRALTDPQRGFGTRAIDAQPEAIHYLATVSDGDARRGLGALEVAILSSSAEPVKLDVALARESVQHKAITYDRDGDTHYDCASALIKSIRGSDVDAGIYWLARMLEGGEDIRFLSRRLVILASEDIGNADPHALPLAIATMQACEFVGLPECQFGLAQAVAYLACAPKSNAATLAIAKARHDVRENRVVPVPRHLRDGHYQGAALLEHGANYQYAHDAPDAIAQQEYLGIDATYYEPTERGFEQELRARLAQIRTRLHGDGDDASD